MIGTPLLAGCMAGGVTSVVLWKFLFDSWSEFGSCLRFWFTPDWLSFFRGEYLADRMSEWKLMLWGGGSACVGYGVYCWLL